MKQSLQNIQYRYVARLRICIIRPGGEVEELWDWRRRFVPAPLPIPHEPGRLGCAKGLTEYHVAEQFPSAREFYAGLPKDDAEVRSLMRRAKELEEQQEVVGEGVDREKDGVLDGTRTSRMCCVRLELEDWAMAVTAGVVAGRGKQDGEEVPNMELDDMELGDDEDAPEPPAKRPKMKERLLPPDDDAVVPPRARLGVKSSPGGGAAAASSTKKATVPALSSPGRGEQSSPPPLPPQHSAEVPRKLVFLQTLFFNGGAESLQRALDHRAATGYALLPVAGAAIPLSADFYLDIVDLDSDSESGEDGGGGKMQRKT